MTKQYNKIVISGGDFHLRTPGEDLWIARRRKGLTQRQAAEKAGVGKEAWWKAEKDLGPPPRLRWRWRPLRPGPTVPELLALARRRSGLSLVTAAKLAGTTPPTLLAWERAGNEGMVAFWEGRGYGPFPFR